MTIIIENASFSFSKAIKELAKIDGAIVKTENKNNSERYTRELLRSIKQDEKIIKKAKNNGTLKLYNSVEEAFSDL